MNNLDETKVKDLIATVVSDIMSCFDPNQFNKVVTESIYSKIASANLLQDQPPCATVKYQNPGGEPIGGYGYEQSNGKTT